MNNIFKSFLLISLTLFLVHCSKDDDPTGEEFAVAFENPSLILNSDDAEVQINVVFSSPAPASGQLTVVIDSDGPVYGINRDFTTNPPVDNNKILVPFSQGENGTTFILNKINNAPEDQEWKLTFTLTESSVSNTIISGNTSMEIFFYDAASVGGNLSPQVGGPNEPYSVFIDLSGNATFASKRDIWDFAFHNGDEFRVKLNGSVYMAASALGTADMEAVTTASVSHLFDIVAVGTFDETNMEYIDGVTGDISNTAIAEVKENPNENEVYLINRGYYVGTETPPVGSVEVTGDHRGWIKARFIRDGNDYIIEYGALDATGNQIQSKRISKNPGSDFEFYSVESHATVAVSPGKNWDMVFTVFTNEIPTFGSYGYTDFVVTNRLSNVKAYMMSDTDSAYDSFTKADVVEGSFEIDQRGIGDKWRNGGGPGMSPSIKDDVFFVLKDVDGNYYKIKFTGLVNDTGERGHPTFRYALLQ
jgi:hypothetical protein